MYNHQIPPGAADVVHYRLDVPGNVRASITVEVRLQYRKFDTTYMKHVYGEDFANDLPIMTLAVDRMTFPVRDEDVQNEPSEIPVWERWNDYGIGMLLKGGKTKGELRRAEEAFIQVEALGRPDGPLNLARVYLQQGMVQDQAIEALGRAAAFDPPAPGWSVAWFTGLVNKQNGFLDEAIASFKSIVEADDAETRQRGFDFGQDYRLLNEIGLTFFERAKQERGEANRSQRERFLQDARSYFDRALVFDPENITAHYNLSLILRQVGERNEGMAHLEQYQKYKPDDNARGQAVAVARMNDPAANHAAEAIVIYDLNRREAFERTLGTGGRRATRYELGVPDQ